MNVFFVLIVTLAVVVLVRAALKMYRMNKYVKNVPTLSWRIYWYVATAKLRSEDIFTALERLSFSGEGLMKSWLFTKLVLGSDDPKDIKLILNSKHCVEKPYVYRLIAGIARGIFGSQADPWRSDRKHINAVFTLSILKTFVPIFNRHFAQLAQNLDKHVNQPEFDMTESIFSCNYDIVCETILRYDSRTQIGENKESLTWMTRMWKCSEERIMNLYLHFDIIHRFSSIYAESKAVAQYFVNYGETVRQDVQNKRATDCSNEIDRSTTDVVRRAKPTLLIDKLIEMEQLGVIDHPRVIDQINTFIVAGTDTSSITMLSLLLILAMHEDVQERVYEEMRTHVNDIDHLHYDTLSKLEYMERAIKETMRLYPLAQILVRESTEDTQLTNCVIPKGTLLLLCVFKMHRSKAIWGPTANEFDPERFLPEAMVGRHPYAYLPFSAGPRNCIGAKYAMISMKIMICRLLNAYKLSTKLKMSDIELKFEVLLKIKNRCLIKVERRQ